MPSDFADAGKRFKDALYVPELPMNSIRDRSRAKRITHRSQLIIACALALLAIVGSGAVLAAKMSGIRIWLSGNKAAVALHSLATIVNPKPEDLRRIMADATFPVVLPVGLPTGLHTDRIIFSPADHPNVIDLGYRDGKTTSGWEFVLADSSTLETGAIPPLMDGGKPPIATVRQWTVGGETVIMVRPSQFTDQPEIEAAMSRATPSQSLAQTLPALYRITMLDYFSDSFRLEDVADTIAPADGRTVLLGAGSLGQVATLVRERKPMLAMRMRIFDNIPTVSGKPDLGNATGHIDRAVAVRVDGVRAIAAVLALGECGSAPKFTCEILFNERNGHEYRIWALPLRSPTMPVKYVVDAKTLHVERSK